MHVAFAGSIVFLEVMHHHVRAAILDGRYNEIVVHEFDSSGERDYIVLPSNMAAFM
jgi:hypothetical protein